MRNRRLPSDVLSDTPEGLLLANQILFEQFKLLGWVHFVCCVARLYFTDTELAYFWRLPETIPSHLQDPMRFHAVLFLFIASMLLCSLLLLVTLLASLLNGSSGRRFATGIAGDESNVMHVVRRLRLWSIPLFVVVALLVFIFWPPGRFVTVHLVLVFVVVFPVVLVLAPLRARRLVSIHASRDTGEIVNGEGDKPAE